MAKSENSGICYERVLFCSDLSEDSKLAFSFAVDAVVKSGGCEMYLLHVVPESESQFWKSYIYEVEGVDNKAKRDIDLKIDEMYRSRLPGGVRLQVEFRVGRETEEILEFAKEVGADLIVLGRQGHGRLQAALFGDIAGKVTRKANCPVLVVPTVEKK